LAVWLCTDVVAIFVISVFGLQARGVQSPNVMVGVLLFFGGLSQFVAGIMEFVTGNTVRSIGSTATLQATSELTGK
jgi:succinate-acetate transporter protein